MKIPKLFRKKMSAMVAEIEQNHNRNVIVFETLKKQEAAGVKVRWDIHAPQVRYWKNLEH